MGTRTELSFRDRAILRAVATGHSDFSSESSQASTSTASSAPIRSQPTALPTSASSPRQPHRRGYSRQDRAAGGGTPHHHSTATRRRSLIQPPVRARVIARRRHVEWRTTKGLDT
jgi:hypothetical protein